MRTRLGLAPGCLSLCQVEGFLHHCKTRPTALQPQPLPVMIPWAPQKMAKKGTKWCSEESGTWPAQ